MQQFIFRHSSSFSPVVFVHQSCLLDTWINSLEAGILIFYFSGIFVFLLRYSIVSFLVLFNIGDEVQRLPLTIVSFPFYLVPWWLFFMINIKLFPLRTPPAIPFNINVVAARRFAVFANISFQKIFRPNLVEGITVSLSPCYKWDQTRATYLTMFLYTFDTWYVTVIDCPN